MYRWRKPAAAASLWRPIPGGQMILSIPSSSLRREEMVHASPWLVLAWADGTEERGFCGSLVARRRIVARRKKYDLIGFGGLRRGLQFPTCGIETTRWQRGGRGIARRGSGRPGRILRRQGNAHPIANVAHLVFDAVQPPASFYKYQIGIKSYVGIEGAVGSHGNCSR